MKTVKVLKCIPKSRGNVYNDYKYPEWKGESIPIECPDWNPNAKCGNGFHGITKDINIYNIFDHGPLYQVMEVDNNPDNFIIIDDEKVKFHKGNIIYQGEDGYKALRMIFDSDEEMVNWFQFSLEYIKPEYQTKELQLLSVKKNGWTIQYIRAEDQTEELQLLAVRYNPYALEYCYNPTYNVMYEAVKQNGYSIQWVKPEDQTKKLQLLAIKRNVDALEFCHKPSYKVMYEAVKRDANAMYHIKPEDQTEELQLMAIKEIYWGIDFCHNPSEKVKQLHRELWE